MNEQEVREFEENIVKGANIAFQRLVNQKKKEDGELVFSRNGHIFLSLIHISEPTRPY